MEGGKKRSIIESSIIKPKGNVMDEKLVSAEAILRHLEEIVESRIYSATSQRDVLDELVIRIQNDLDEMLEDMYRDQQERNKQIEIRLDDAYGNADRLGDVLAGGSF